VATTQVIGPPRNDQAGRVAVPRVGPLLPTLGQNIHPNRNGTPLSPRVRLQNLDFPVSMRLGADQFVEESLLARRDQQAVEVRHY
jgi:hypothetical protein